MPKLEPNQDLTIGDLMEVHELYALNKKEWRFLMAAYEGTKELVRLGYLGRNERETEKNYERRENEASGFDYTKSIVDLFNYYLFKKDPKRFLGKLDKDPLWDLFTKNCNLYGDGFNDFLTEQGRYSSIEGHVGIIVDKPNRKIESRAQEISEEIYPYLAAYLPTAILDWEYERDQNNRPYLSYLKLKDDDDKYRLWWPGKWEIWEVPVGRDIVEDVASGKKIISSPISKDTKAKKVGNGEYPLNKIPFVWLINIKSKNRPIGVSDVHEVARLDVGILRNVSQGEEVISYTAFPMMRKPKKEAKPDGGISSPAEDTVAPTAILEFDPEHPESKPDWLSSEAQPAISAILEWISIKREEIYRTVNAGGMASTEISTTAKSGVALKTEFQLLNASLVRKAKNLEKAELDIIKYWLAWQMQENYFKDITVERERTYDVEDLAQDLENILTSQLIVKSKIFNDRMQKKVVRAMLPAVEDDEIKKIDKEIDDYVEPSPFEIPSEEQQNVGY